MGGAMVPMPPAEHAFAQLRMLKSLPLTEAALAPFSQMALSGSAWITS